MADKGREEKGREKELKKVVSDIEGQFYKGAIMLLGEKSAQDVECISTGALSLDIALGGRGIPRGRITEIYGHEASGKTTIALHTLACAQKAGGVAAFIDVEHALDPAWAKRLGVDLESLLVSQPNNAEEALKIAEMLVKSAAVDVIVVDSVAALVPKAEVDGEIGDSHVGILARLMSQALRILNPTVSKTNTSLIFINQIRQKIGVMFGNPETTSGGLALKFYSSVRLEVRKTGWVKEGDEAVGAEVKVKVVKNKVAPPFREARFELMHDEGISAEGDLINMALEEELVTKSGSWFKYGDVQLGQGKQGAKQYLRDNPEVREEIKRKVCEARGVAVPAAAPPAEANGAIEEPLPPPTKGRKQAAATE